jgi:hypothetical protein
MYEVPTIDSGSNWADIRIGDTVLYFSYRTLIAYRHPRAGRVVSENVWGPTTGKHLNAIDGGDKKSRLDRSAFEAQACADLGELVSVTA